MSTNICTTFQKKKKKSWTFRNLKPKNNNNNDLSTLEIYRTLANHHRRLHSTRSPRYRSPRAHHLPSNWKKNEKIEKKTLENNVKHTWISVGIRQYLQTVLFVLCATTTYRLGHTLLWNTKNNKLLLHLYIQHDLMIYLTIAATQSTCRSLDLCTETSVWRDVNWFFKECFENLNVNIW